MNICDSLPLYLYGEMDAAQKQEFEKHIASCRECESSLKTFNSLKNKELKNAPLNVINDIFYKTTRKKSIFAFDFPKTWKLGLAAAACLLIGVFAIPSKYTKNALIDGLPATYEEMESIDADLNYFEANFML